MRKLALKDEILLQVEKPARYIGGEVNAVMKDKSRVDVRFAMCFPDVYEIGMSHLGIQIIYDMLNLKMCGVKGYIPPGWIWIKSCGGRGYPCLPWNPRNP